MSPDTLTLATLLSRELNRAILIYIVNNSTDMELWRAAASPNLDIPRFRNIPRFFVRLLRDLDLLVDEMTALDETPQHCFACHKTYLERDNSVNACLYTRYPARVEPSWLSSNGHHPSDRFPVRRRHCRTMEEAGMPMELCCMRWIIQGPRSTKVGSRASTPAEYKIVMTYFIQNYKPLELRWFLLLALVKTPRICDGFMWMFMAMGILTVETWNDAAVKVCDLGLKHCTQCHQDYMECHNGLGQCVIPGRTKAVGDTRHRNFSFRHEDVRNPLSTVPKISCVDSVCVMVGV